MVVPIARTEHLVQRMALSGRVEDTAARGRGAVRLLRTVHELACADEEGRDLWGRIGTHLGFRDC